MNNIMYAGARSPASCMCVMLLNMYRSKTHRRARTHRTHRTHAGRGICSHRHPLCCQLLGACLCILLCSNPVPNVAYECVVMCSRAFACFSCIMPLWWHIFEVLSPFSVYLLRQSIGAVFHNDYCTGRRIRRAYWKYVYIHIVQHTANENERNRRVCVRIIRDGAAERNERKRYL